MANDIRTTGAGGTPPVPGDAAAHPTSGRPARTGMAAVLIAIATLPVLGSVLISPVLPQLSAAYRTVPAAAVLVPLVLTIPSLAIALTAPFAGSLADRLGRRRLLLGGLVLYAILGTAPLYLPSLGAILVSRVLVGITEAVILTSSTALLTDYFSGQRRNRYLALSTLITSLAGGVFLVLGGALGTQGWRAPFVLYAVSLLVAVPVLMMLWEPGAGRSREAVHAPLSRIPARFLTLQLVVGFVAGIVFFSVIVEMPYVYSDLGVRSSATIGQFAGLSSLASAAGALAFRWAARVGVARLVPSMLGAAAVGLVLVWLAPTAVVALLGAVVTAFCTGLLIPMGLTWIVAPLATDQRGRAVGAGTATLFVGQFVCPLVVLALQGITGSLAGAMGLLAVVSAAGALVFGLILARRAEPDLRATSLL